MDITKVYQDIQHEFSEGIKTYNATYKVLTDILNNKLNILMGLISSNLTISEVLATSVELYSNEIIIHFVYEYIRCELIIYTVEPNKIRFIFYSLRNNALLKTTILSLNSESTGKIDEILLK